MRAFYRRIREHPQIIKRPGLAQFIKFSVVGASNTVIDFGVYLLSTRVLGFYYLIGNVISFTVAGTWSYVINRKWTFRDTTTRVHTQYLKFLIVSLVGLGLTSLLLYLFVHHLHLHDIVGKALAVAIVLIWNFSLNRLWTFRKPVLAN